MSIFDTDTLTISRVSGKTLTKGTYSAGTTTTFTATGNLQPAGKDDLLKLPEGYRNRDVRLFMTHEDIHLNDSTTIGGIIYIAMTNEPFEGVTSIGRNEILFVKDRGQ